MAETLTPAGLSIEQLESMSNEHRMDLYRRANEGDPALARKPAGSYRGESLADPAKKMRGTTPYGMRKREFAFGPYESGLPYKDVYERADIDHRMGDPRAYRRPPSMLDDAVTAAKGFTGKAGQLAGQTARAAKAAFDTPLGRLAARGASKLNPLAFPLALADVTYESKNLAESPGADLLIPYLTGGKEAAFEQFKKREKRQDLPSYEQAQMRMDGMGAGPKPKKSK